MIRNITTQSAIEAHFGKMETDVEFYARADKMARTRATKKTLPLLALALVAGMASCLPDYADAASANVCAPTVRADVQTWLDLGMKEHEIARMLAKRAYEDDTQKIGLCFIEWSSGNVGVSASTVYIHGDKKGKGRYNGRFATYTPSTTTWN